MMALARFVRSEETLQVSGRGGLVRIWATKAPARYIHQYFGGDSTSEPTSTAIVVGAKVVATRVVPGELGGKPERGVHAAREGGIGTMATPLR